MQSQIREREGITIIDFDGQLRGPDCKGFMTLIEQVLNDGKKKIVLNFDQVTFIDSGCIGSLMNARKAVVGQNAELAVMNLSDDQRDLFEMTRISSIFRIYLSETEMLDRMR